MHQIRVIDTNVTAHGSQEQLHLMLEWAKTNSSRAVFVANVHMIMEAYGNAEFARALNQADLVTPDGMPLVWMLRLQGAKKQDRMAGLDTMTGLCSLAEAHNVPIFLLGSLPDVLAAVCRRLKHEYPNLQIAGTESPPFRPLTEGEDDRLIARINASGAGIVFVALGCPKQERWIHEHKGRISAVMIGIGGAIPVYAGIQKRAPGFIRAWGLEWAFRLIQEPKRLWRRYLKTNIPFLLLASQQIFSNIVHNKNRSGGFR